VTQSSPFERSPETGTVVNSDKEAFQGGNAIADTISRAIIWNHGFIAPEQVLRTYEKWQKKGASDSDFAHGVADAFSFMLTGGLSSKDFVPIKHGDIIAIYHAKSDRYLRMKKDSLEFGPHSSSLSRETGSELFLVVAVDDKFGFYNIRHNRYIRVSGKRLDGKGGIVLTEAPRQGELFEVRQSIGRRDFVRIQASSKRFVEFSYVTKKGKPFPAVGDEKADSEFQMFQIIRITDHKSDKF
jgi:hypothetical protein